MVPDWIDSTVVLPMTERGSINSTCRNAAARPKSASRLISIPGTIAPPRYSPLRQSPLALRCLKSALNADCDGQAGLQELAGNATLLYYMSEEAQEGRDAWVQKRRPDFGRFPRRP